MSQKKESELEAANRQLEELESQLLLLREQNQAKEKEIQWLRTVQLDANEEIKRRLESADRMIREQTGTVMTTSSDQ